MADAVNAIVWFVVILVVAVLFKSRRRFRGRVGPGAIGTVYNLLNEEKHNAVEVIVEERTGERDPEDRDGDLPQLENPARRPRGAADR